MMMIFPLRRICRYYLTVTLGFCLLYSAATSAASEDAQPLSPELKASIESAVNDLGTMILVQDIKPNEVFPLLEQFLSDHPGIYGTALAYAPNDITPGACPYVYRHKGSLVEKDLANKDYDYTGKDWYTLPRDNHKAMWSAPYIDKGGGDVKMTTFSMPLYQDGGDGALVGVLTADVVVN